MKGDHTPKPRVIVKKGHGGGHHGGAWKVACSDFVTTMMALFIVLWIVGQNETTREAVAQYFKDPGAFKQGSAASLAHGGSGLLPRPGWPGPAHRPAPRPAGNVGRQLARGGRARAQGRRRRLQGEDGAPRSH